MSCLACLRRVSAAPRFLLAAWTLSLGACALVAAPVSAAPIGLEAFGGWDTNGNNDFLLGAGARLSLASITIIPNGEYYFVDGGNRYTLNLDATLSVIPLGVASGYVGAGIGMLTFDPDGGSSNTNSGINVLAGFGLNAVPLKPYAQLKYVFTDGGDPIVFTIGARF